MHARCHECDETFSIRRVGDPVVCPCCGSDQAVRRGRAPTKQERWGRGPIPFGRGERPFGVRLAEGFALLGPHFELLSDVEDQEP